MINHARTLLANVRADTGSDISDTIGAEIVDPTFNPLVLSRTLSDIRTILFGTDPDTLMLNYRCLQYMSLLHGIGLETWIKALDERVTYDMQDKDDRLFQDAFATSYTQLSSLDTPKRLFFFGGHTADEVKGRLTAAWTLAVGDSAVIAMHPTLSSASSVATEFDVTDGLSELLYLPGSSLGFRFENALNTSWRVSSAAPPTRTLMDIFTQLDVHLRAGSARSIFLSSAEPFETAKNLWISHPQCTHKLAGILLAYIYSLETLRLGGI